MHDGLQATALAVSSYASACRGLRAMPEAQAIRPQLDLSIARLELMRRDLDRRLHAGDGQDNLFIALQVAQAGLSSLTDAIGETLQDYTALQPRVEPPQGRFIPEEDDAPAPVRQRRG